MGEILSESGVPVGQRIYGRSRLRRMRPRRLRALESGLPRFRIDPEDVGGLWETVFGPHVCRVELEIGFGGGEHLLHRAAQHRDTGFIGVEPFIDGVAKTVGAIIAQGLTNVFLYDGGVWDILPSIPCGSMTRVSILFPDPWPKKRHWKRRLVSSELVEEVDRILRDGGELRIASDIPDYVDWMMRRIGKCERLVWQVQGSRDWSTRPEDWVETRYESRGLRSGRAVTYLNFVKAEC